MTARVPAETPPSPLTETRCAATHGSSYRLGRICVTLPAQGRAYDEMVSVLSAVIRELGGEVFLARDGDRAILEADVVILFGLCSAFDVSAGLLSVHSQQRPATILWHVEPLPPGIIPAQAGDAVQRLIHCDVSRLPKPLPALVRRIPGHRGLVKLVRQARCAELVRRCGWDDRVPRTRVHAREWYYAVKHAVWLRQSYSHEWCDFVAASTMPRCRVLTEMGIPCEYAPLGYHPLWGTDRGQDRDIDVVFLGCVRRTGRERLISQVARRLARAGVKLVIVDRDCYGEDRTRLLNRARISLDLGRNTWEMPVLRLLVSTACGALVVSNRPVDPHPFRDEHLVRVDSDSLAPAILKYLHDEAARQQVVGRARRHLTTELAWDPVVSRVLHRALARGETSKGVAS